MNVLGTPRGNDAHDLYICCASIDDSSGWVTRLASELRAHLAMRIGRDITIHLSNKEDARTEAPAAPDERLLLNSSLFVAVISPDFAGSTYCMRQLSTFVVRFDGSRVVSVITRPANLPFSFKFECPFYFNIAPYPAEKARADRAEFFGKLVDHLALLLKSLEIKEGVVSTFFESIKDLSIDPTPLHLPEKPVRMEVFLCHSSGDKASVRNLCYKLQKDGFAPWLDEKALLAGQEWEFEIKKAIDRAGAIIVCISKSSINKEGYLQREIRLVLDKAAEKPEGTIFLIPARLEDCPVPERLRNRQWVDLFDESGYAHLLQALHVRATTLP